MNNAKELIEEKIRRQSDVTEWQIKYDIAMQKAKRSETDLKTSDLVGTKPDGYIVSEERRVYLLDILGKAAAALLHEAQKVAMQVDKEKLSERAREVHEAAFTLGPKMGFQEAVDINESYERLGDARAHVRNGRLELKKLRKSLGRRYDTEHYGMGLIMDDYIITKDGV